MALWSWLSGIALVVPLIGLITLWPLLAPDAVTAAAASRRITAYFLDPWSVVLKAMIVYPLIEEGFYRGLLLPFFRRRFPLWLSVALPTALFAITHVGSGLANVLFALVAGLYFSWLVLRSGSLFPAILCHSATNFGVLFLFRPIMEARGFTTPGSLLQPLPLVLLGASLLVLGVAVTILSSEFKRPRAPAPL